MALSEVFLLECPPAAAAEELRKLEKTVRSGLRRRQEGDAPGSEVLAGGEAWVPLAPFTEGLEVVGAQRDPAQLTVLVCPPHPGCEEYGELQKATKFLLVDALQFNWEGTETRVCAVVSLRPGVFRGRAAAGGTWEAAEKRERPEDAVLAAAGKHAEWPPERAAAWPWKTAHDAIFRTASAASALAVLDVAPKEMPPLESCAKCGKELFDVALLAQPPAVAVARAHCLQCSTAGHLVPVPRTRQTGVEMVFAGMPVLAQWSGGCKVVARTAFAAMLMPSVPGLLAEAAARLRRAGAGDVPELAWGKNTELFRG
jgi:hypothetical protein